MTRVKNKSILIISLLAILLMSTCLLFSGCDDDSSENFVHSKSEATYNLDAKGTFKNITYQYGSQWKQTEQGNTITYTVDNKHDFVIIAEDTGKMTADKFYKTQKKEYSNKEAYKNTSFKEINKTKKEVNGVKYDVYAYLVKATSISTNEEINNIYKIACAPNNTGYVVFEEVAKNGNTDLSLFDKFMQNVSLTTDSSAQ